MSVGTSAKAAKLLHYIGSKYKNVGLTIASMATNRVTMQATLYQIESLIEQDLAMHLVWRDGLVSNLRLTGLLLLFLKSSWTNLKTNRIDETGQSAMPMERELNPRPLVADSQSIFSNNFSHDGNPGRSLLLFGLEG